MCGPGAANAQRRDAAVRARQTAGPAIVEGRTRDLNIALMNEVAIIFDKLAIDISAVPAAADTKWNFL